MTHRRLLSIDHGLARLGIAISDASGIVARPLTIIERRSKREDFEQLSQIIAENKPVAIVVGMPYSDVEEGVFTQADKVRNWLAHLRQATTLPIVEWDESLTSDDAREWAAELGRAPRDPIDDLAATLILQSYLDALHTGDASLTVE